MSGSSLFLTDLIEVFNMAKQRIMGISITVVVLGLITYFLYSLIMGWHDDRIETARNQEQKIWQEQAEALKRKVEDLEEEITRLKGQGIPRERLDEAFGEGTSFRVSESMTLEQIEEQVAAFFAYLDQKGYVERNNLSGSTYNQYELSMTELTAKPPIASGETQNLYNLFYNMAYFYRVLGKERLNLVKDILKNESEIIESAMKTFYLWYTFEDVAEETIKGKPSLKTMYDYACFFLNTLGGRSYLLRRDSKTRILTTYYCVLILDKANDRKLNSNGIDIRPHIISAGKEIASYMGLINQRDYLRKLEDLKTKYKISQASVHSSQG
jgi:cell division protein FtsB